MAAVFVFFFFLVGSSCAAAAPCTYVNTNIVRTLYVAQIMAPLNVCAIPVLYRRNVVAVNKLFAMFLFWVLPFLFFRLAQQCPDCAVDHDIYTIILQEFSIW